MRRLGFFFCVAIGIVSFFNAHAQSVSECAQLEANGIYNTVELKTSESQLRQTQSFFEANHFQSSKEAADAGAKIGIPLGGLLGIDFGGYSSSAHFEQWQAAFVSTDSSSVASLQSFSIITKTISEALVAEVRRCISRPGLHSYIERVPGSGYFSVEVVYNSVGRPFQTRAAFSISPGDVRATCEPNNIVTAGVLLDSGGASFHCKRDPKQAVVVTVNTDNGTETLHLNGDTLAKPATVSLPPAECNMDGKTLVGSGAPAGFPNYPYGEDMTWTSNSPPSVVLGYSRTDDVVPEEIISRDKTGHTEFNYGPLLGKKGPIWFILECGNQPPNVSGVFYHQSISATVY